MLSSTTNNNEGSSQPSIPVNMKKLNQLVWKIFTKGFGLTLQADAASFLADKITSYSMNENQMNEFLNYMAQNYSKISKDRSGMVNSANIELVFNQVYQAHDYKGSKEAQDVRNYIKILDLNQIPKFEYDVHGKNFKQISRKIGSFYESSSDKILYSLRRFNTVKQRLLKRLRSENDSFTKITLTPIKSIKGINSPTLEKFIFGQITEMTEGIFALEDPEEFIPLDFTEMKLDSNSDYVMEGGLFLLNGVCLGNKFSVRGIQAAKCESRQETMSMLTHPDISEATNFAEPVHELKQMELTAKNSRFVVISDVWLDQPQVLERLKSLFDGFNAHGNLPELFVLIGPFSSNPPKDGPRAWIHYQNLFDSFAEFIERIKNVRNCRFVFVPSAADPGFVESVLPRPPIPAAIFDAWKKAKFDFVAASNPCRIVYFTQEIVIFKQELTQIMRKKSLNTYLETISEKKMSSREEIDKFDPELTQQVTKLSPDYQRAIKSCLDQSSLNPQSLNNQTALWDSDHSLSLYPIPDVFVVAERQASYEFSYEDCKCANPGSFPSSEGSFLLYNPAQKRFDLCEMPKKQ